MKNFSAFVAAEAEASEPVVEKEEAEDPMKKPLHFKYYQNEGEDDNSLIDQTTDSLLGAASHDVTKR